MSTLREHLQSIYDQHQKLTPRLVVDEARDQGHPLHNRFEWDDAVAGEKYRQSQAAELIRSVKVKYSVGDKAGEVRSWVSVARSDGHVYEPVEKVAEDDVSRRIVLRAMEREFNQMKDRYSQFAEFTDMLRREVEAA